MTTALFQALHGRPRAGFDADELNLGALQALEAAERAFYGALGAAHAEWLALPEGGAKASAEQNAWDTEGTDEDELYWLQIALATYAMTPEGGW